MGIFDSKHFNGQVFGKYVESEPNLNRNELIKSGAVKKRQDIATSLKDQVGGNYVSLPIFGRITKGTQNYDGATDITANKSKTYMQGRIVVGRSDAWTENDFSYDVTGGVDFLKQVGSQVAEYWDDVDQATILSILKGIFSMTGAKNLKFVNNHTYDISGKSGGIAIGNNITMPANVFSATTLNNAIQKALGDNKAKFKMAFMHSAVATNLENLKLLAYMKYTDAQGIERQLSIATLNGRVVFIDDNMPTEEVDETYALTKDTTLNTSKTYYTRTGSKAPYTYTTVSNPSVDNITTYYEKTDDAYVKYTSYVLGEGAIEYTDCGVKVPYETDRDKKKNGGEDYLISRQRKIFSPIGISFNDSNIISPTDEQLEDGSKWELAPCADSNSNPYPEKAIPIARIITRG